MQEKYKIIELQLGINKLGRRKNQLWSTDKTVNRKICNINVTKVSPESKVVMHVENIRDKRAIFIFHDDKMSCSSATKIEPHNGLIAWLNTFAP